MATIKFTVPAVPVAQPRQRHRIIGGGDTQFVHNYTPANNPVNAFKAGLRIAAREAYGGPPLEGPLRIDVTFVFPRHSNKVWKTREMPRYPHIQKPDRDNLDKAVLDSLKGTIIVDDCQVYAGTIEKWRAAGDEQPHCVVRIETTSEVKE